MRFRVVAAVLGLVLCRGSMALEPDVTVVQAQGAAVLVRHVQAQGPSVVFVHGSTFPSALSFGYRRDGTSWLEEFAARGFDVWTFDFAGFGGSREAPSYLLDDGRSMNAKAAASQIGAVVRHILERTGRRAVSVVAHSWGTLPAEWFAALHPDEVTRLVLYGPVARRDGPRTAGLPVGPCLIDGESQWQAFRNGIPETEVDVFTRDDFQPWLQQYLETDPASRSRTPPSVHVPCGPLLDVALAWSGVFDVPLEIIRVPTTIVRGEWDPVARDDDVRWLITHLSAVPGGASDVKLPRGGHRMHLERGRQRLFDAVETILRTGDER
jgi:pimeloyl-ACP methyl ester carboxylesterase